MTLSAPEEREPIHHRRIDCRGYRRADGLWDIEGHLTDVKSYPFPNKFRGEIQPGEPLHDMWLRLTLDDDLTVIKAEAVHGCRAIRRLSGNHACICQARRAEDRSRLAAPGQRRCSAACRAAPIWWSCLGPLATTAYQTIQSWNAQRNPKTETDRPPPHLNTCHALARDGEVVKEHYPRWYEGE